MIIVTDRNLNLIKINIPRLFFFRADSSTLRNIFDNREVLIFVAAKEAFKRKKESLPEKGL